MTWLSSAVDLFTQERRTYGDLLTPGWLKHALQIPEPKTIAEVTSLQFLLLNRMDAFRDFLLLEHKIVLQNVRGEGYRVVHPREQAELAATEMLKYIRKGLEVGDKIIANVKTEALTDAELRRHTDTQVRLGGIGALLKRPRRDLLQQFKPQS